MAFTATEKKEFQGFGGLVPPAAGFKTAGAIWASSIFPDRAPAGFHLLAGFYGGALRPEVSEKSAEEISALLQAENKILYGREALFFPDVTIWKNAIPSYDLQRKLALAELENCTPSGIRFLANWKAGIGLADCIRNAIKISESIY
jgi:oxygen-dependent protoporphyrinogen oxidase